jgi:hypothetical protein
VKSGSVQQNGKTLLIPDKPDEERDAVAAAWCESGGEVIRLARFWEPPALKNDSVCLYGGSNFSLVVAQKLGLELISPTDDWLLNLNPKWLKRNIFSRTLAEIENVDFPTFVKPLVPKTFRAAVYRTSQELADECKGLEKETKLLLGEIVHFEAEARGFVARQELLDCQIYEGNNQLYGADNFIRDFLHEESLPLTCVIDVGFITGRGWSIVEANASWGAGLNGCDARRILPAIALATKASTRDGRA